MVTNRTGRAGWVAVLAGLSVGVAGAAAQGPDVTLLDVTGTQNYGVVGDVRAYAISSHTCNIGNQSLIWANSGSPVLGMNAFRLHDGRLMQIGLSFGKTACCAAAQTGACGSCSGPGGNLLGPGCLDVYSASWNGGQGRLAARSAINAYTGAFSSFSTATGNTVFKRLQVRTTDLANTTTYAGAQYFIEGVYVGTDDAANGNAHNNATYKRVNLDAAGNMTPTGAASMGIPAIRAWRDHGLGAGVPDFDVTVSTVEVPAEGRFWYAVKATDNGNGTWRYDYAVYNLNSDRSGGSFAVPIPSGVTVTDIGFNAPFYHSNEVYSNDPWVVSTSGGEVRWSSPQTFAQNANTNALRWGTMYNFWFTANTAPQAVGASLGLFKPHTPSSVSFQVLAPKSGEPCYANCNNSTVPPILSVDDFVCFQQAFAAGDSYANCDNSTTPPILNANDFVCFQQLFSAGCK